GGNRNDIFVHPLPRRSRVKCRWRVWIYGDFVDACRTQAVGRFNPVGATVGTFEDAGAGAGIDDGRIGLVHGQGADIVVGNAAVGRKPRCAAISALEDTAVGPGVKGGTGIRIDGEGERLRIGQPGSGRVPGEPAVRALEDTAIRAA